MLIVNVEKTGSIEKALKVLKRKFSSTKVVDELRERKQFKKPSVKRRETVKKAKFKEQFRKEHGE